MLIAIQTFEFDVTLVKDLNKKILTYRRGMLSILQYMETDMPLELLSDVTFFIVKLYNALIEVT